MFERISRSEMPTPTAATGQADLTGDAGLAPDVQGGSRPAGGTYGGQASTPGSPFAGGPLPPPDSGNPYASPSVPYGWQPLGEVQQIVRGYQPSAIDLGDILSRSWRIFSNHFAECLLATLICFAVSLALTGMLAVFGLLGGAGVGALANTNNKEAAILLGIFLGLVGILALGIFSAWLWAGYLIWVLKLSRGEEVAYGDLFRGGPFMGRMFWGNLLFMPVSLLAVLLCFFPCILIWALWTNFAWLVIDRNERLPESFARAKDLAVYNSSNFLTLVMIWFLMFGVSVVLSMLPVIGGLSFLFTMPFFTVLEAVAYLRLTGQSTADMLPPTMSR
jgi:hypothetical protein